MSQIDKKIANEIREIANGTDDNFTVMSGKVIAGSVNETEGTCTVLLSVNDESAPTENILLNAVTDNVNGLLIIPADDSQVWVTEIDEGKWGIIKTSDVKKVIVKISGTQEMAVESGKIVFNGGGNNGMVKVGALVSKLNALENDLNNLKMAINGWIVVPNDGGAALKVALTSYLTSTLSPTTATDLENTNVKH